MNHTRIEVWHYTPAGTKCAGLAKRRERHVLALTARVPAPPLSIDVVNAVNTLRKGYPAPPEWPESCRGSFSGKLYRGPGYFIRVFLVQALEIELPGALDVPRSKHKRDCAMLQPIKHGAIAEHAPCDCGGGRK